MAIVYQHIRKDKNQVFYIGIGQEFKRAYVSNKTERNPIWHHIVDKSDWEVEILFDDVTWEEACQFEKDFIHLHGRIDKGTGTLANMTDGGDGANGAKPNKTSFKKGQVPWNLGISHTDETKQKMSKPRLNTENMKKPRLHTDNMKKPKSIVKCPHCNKEGGSNAMNRWHFDNCKLK